MNYFKKMEAASTSKIFIKVILCADILSDILKISKTIYRLVESGFKSDIKNKL